jgi:hypothetical protein
MLLPWKMSLSQWIIDLLSRLYRFALDVVAALIADLLSHPKVEEVVSNAMVVGMNKFMEQPDLAEHLKKMTETLSEEQEAAVGQMGKDFPKLVGRFMGGAYKSIRGQDDEKMKVKDGNMIDEDESKKDV